MDEQRRTYSSTKAKQGQTPKCALLAWMLPTAVLFSGSAGAQSVGDFRLQPSTPTTAPQVQGPVDPDSPVSTPAPAAPSPTTSAPAPAATGTPAPAPPAPSTAAAPPLPQPAPRAVVRPAPSTAAPPTSGIPAAAAPPAALPLPPADAGPAPDAVPLPAPLPGPQAPAAATVPLPAPAGNDGIAWWWLIPAVLLGAGATAFALTRRRRERPVTAPAIERPRPASAAAHPEKAPEPPAPAPLPAAENRPIARHEAAGAPGPIQLELDTVRLSVTLVNATLQYRLRLTNASPATLGPIALGADMIAAHASLPVADQLAQGVGLELRHEIPPLAPGEQAEISGDLRLPLASVTPIRQGKATLLVPLVRLRAESDGVLLARAHVVGETPAVPGGPLRPFRLDQGPRIFGAISQRELPAAA